MAQNDSAEQRERLRQYFSTLTDEQQLKGWDDSWKSNLTPWDRRRPNPALEDALAEKAELSNSSSSAGGKKKVLVPGCGRGPDVLLFASYGFDAYGVDASETGIEAAKEFSREQDQEQQFALKNSNVGRGEVKLICADFFSDSWVPYFGGGIQEEGPFDLIYDHTFLCALPPSLRPRWAARVSELLSPGGILLAFEFPLGKDPKSGGPPHGLSSELYDQILSHPGQDVRYDSNGHVVEDHSNGLSENALVRVETWKPKRTFEGQEKSSKVSVWRHAKQ